MGRHPGGESWLRLTKGQDITEHFITHHLDEEKARKILDKYYVKDCPNNIQRFSFKKDGFYRTVKDKALKRSTKEQLSNETPSKVNAFLILSTWFLFTTLAAVYQSYLAAIVAGALLIGVFGIGHNFIHHK